MSSNATFGVSFWPACNRLPSNCRYLITVILWFLFCLYFFFSPFISLYAFISYFFACNKALTPLNLHVWCPLGYFLWSRLWIVDMNVILAFKSRRKSFDWGFVYPQFREISTTYVLVGICLTHIYFLICRLLSWLVLGLEYNTLSVMHVTS